MNVVFLVGQFPALSETFILNQITGLIERGHAVDIYAEHPAADVAVHPDVARYRLLERTFYEKLPERYLARAVGVPGRLCPGDSRDVAIRLRALNILEWGRQAGSLRLFYTASSFLERRADYDVMVAHFGANGLRGAYLRQIGATRARLVTAFHGVDLTAYPKEFAPGLYDRLWRTGDLFLPISDRWNGLLADLGCPLDKIRVHRMGIDCQRFAIAAHTRRTAGEPVRFVTVARLVAKKGIEDAIQAVARIARAYPALTYDIVGDGPLRGRLQRLIGELAVEGQVTLRGEQAEAGVRAALRNAHAFVAPSYTPVDGDIEGMPVAIMEAMACGLPVLSTRHSGIPELVADGVTGWLVAERDVVGLSARMAHIIEQPVISADMGRAGRAVVEEHYDIEKLNDVLSEILAMVNANSSGAMVSRPSLDGSSSRIGSRNPHRGD